MIFGINTSRESSITYNNFEISLVVFMPNTTTNHTITYTNLMFSSHSKHANLAQKGLLRMRRAAYLTLDFPL